LIAYQPSVCIIQQDLPGVNTHLTMIIVIALETGFSADETDFQKVAIGWWK